MTEKEKCWIEKPIIILTDEQKKLGSEGLKKEIKNLIKKGIFNPENEKDKCVIDYIKATVKELETYEAVQEFRKQISK